MIEGFAGQALRTGLLALCTLSVATGLPAARQDAQAHEAQETSQEQPTGKQQPAFVPPPRRKVIGGIGSVTSVSKLSFPSQPDTIYELESTYVFPQRTRWRLAPYTASRKSGSGEPQEETLEDRRARRLQFQCGEGVWTVAPGKTASEAYTADEKRKTLLQFELRRVGLIWPADLEWKGDGKRRKAELPGLGFLEAELDPASGRPTMLRSSDPDGTPRETLSEIQWRAAEKGPRMWPKSWQLEAGGRVIWAEQFTLVRGGLKYNEAFFLPFDRRQSSRSRSSIVDDVRHIEVPQVATWSRDLSPEACADWSLALAEARRALEKWTSTLADGGFDLDPRPCFLLADDGRPRQLELHLKDLPKDPPTGWSAKGDYAAVRLLMTGVDSLDSSLLLHLRKNLPEGAVAGRPWVMVQLTESGVGLTQVILPALKSH